MIIMVSIMIILETIGLKRNKGGTTSISIKDLVVMVNREEIVLLEMQRS